MANADQSAAPGTVPTCAHPRRPIGIGLTFGVGFAAAAVALLGLGGTPSIANATASQPISGACSIDAGFDGQLLTADDDFAPFPSDRAEEVVSSGEDSALVGDACWVSAAPPVPTAPPAIQIQSSPPVPGAAQLPPVAELPPSAQLAAVGGAAQAASRSAVHSVARPGGPHSGGVSGVFVALAVALFAGLAFVSGRRRRLTWR